MRTSPEKLTAAFGEPPFPATVWQDTYDTTPDALWRLWRSGDIERYSMTLFQYVECLHYIKTQQLELLRCLLPLCMRAWRRSLLYDNMGGFAEQFHAALVERQSLNLLSEGDRKAVYQFMRDSLLDRMDKETSLTIQGGKCPTYDWILFFGSYGTIVPDVESLWQAWWRMEAPGHAIAALQYASCLIYYEHENPVFTLWTPEEGGGVPVLWETESLGFEERWLPENVEYLRRTLTPDYLREKVRLAVQVLQGHAIRSQVARIQTDMETWDVVIKARLSELPDLLAQPSQVGDEREFTI